MFAFMLEFLEYNETTEINDEYDDALTDLWVSVISRNRIGYWDRVHNAEQPARYSFLGPPGLDG